MKYKVQSIMVVDKETGELLNYRNMGLDMEEQKLVHLIVELKEVSNELKNKIGILEADFVERMKKKQATKYEDDEIKISIQNKNDYEYTQEIIEDLKNDLTEEQFNNGFKVKYEGNRNVLKYLISLGGNIKQKIEAATTVIPQKPYLKIEKK